MNTTDTAWAIRDLATRTTKTEQSVFRLGLILDARQDHATRIRALELAQMQAAATPAQTPKGKEFKWTTIWVLGIITLYGLNWLAANPETRQYIIKRTSDRILGMPIK